MFRCFVNHLLFNFLSYTFETIQESSDKVWKFQRYDLIREYVDRPTLAPPLMILSHIFIFIKWIVQLCGCGNKPTYGSALSKRTVVFTDELNLFISVYLLNSKV